MDIFKTATYVIKKKIIKTLREENLMEAMCLLFCKYFITPVPENVTFIYNSFAFLQALTNCMEPDQK